MAILLAMGGWAGAGEPAGGKVMTADAVRVLKSELRDLRFQALCFDRDQAQDDRSIDLTVTDDDDVDAEAFMTGAQASRILDVLAADGFFERATVPDGAHWDPPPQPYYIVWVRGRSLSISELRSADAGLVPLLARVRDALAEGRAAKCADRAVAALRPSSRRWPVPVSLPAPVLPTLPPAASSVHPAYAFRPLEPGWTVQEGLLRPASGHFVSRVDPEPDESREPYRNFFRELRYGCEPDPGDLKTVLLYPGGQVYLETDSYQTGVDLPRGDLFERILDPAGKVRLYVHMTDGKVVDAVSLWPGVPVQGVVDGRGWIRRPTFDPEVYEDVWYYEGLILVERTVEAGRITRSEQRDNTESGHAATMTTFDDGSETLLDGNDLWQRDAGGAVRRASLYTPDPPADPAVDVEAQRKQLTDRYAAVRTRFMARVVARARAAGFSLREMGLDSTRLERTQSHGHGAVEAPTPNDWRSLGASSRSMTTGPRDR
ncbi:MAG: hypothetical protein U0166_01340 [Acidobacteriota bacterium]